MWLAIQTFIFTVAVPLLVHLLKAFGIGIVAFAAASVAVDFAESFIFSQLSQLPASLYSILKIVGFISGLKIYFSSLAAYSLIKFSGSSTAKKFTFSGS